jgi:uncharacterized membrane protein affecting hemolysin expression
MKRPLVRTSIVVLSIAVLVALGFLAYHFSGSLAVMLAMLRKA